MVRKSKKTEKALQDMTKKEKKDFLSMDLIERMIRVEQRVSSSFNKDIPYNGTEYFKGLTDEEKKDFEKHIKKKTKKKGLLFGLFLLPVLVILASRGEVTGNVIKENVGVVAVGWIEMVCLALLVVAAIGIAISSFSSKKRRKRLDKNIKVLDDLLLKKRMTIR